MGYVEHFTTRHNAVDRTFHDAINYARGKTQDAEVVLIIKKPIGLNRGEKTCQRRE